MVYEKKKLLLTHPSSKTRCDRFLVLWYFFAFCFVFHFGNCSRKRPTVVCSFRRSLAPKVNAFVSGTPTKLQFVRSCPEKNGAGRRFDNNKLCSHASRLLFAYLTFSLARWDGGGDGGW